MRERLQNRLSVLEIQHAGDGDHCDGGGLVLRIRGASAVWVLRYSFKGKRREMGLGSAMRDGPSLTTARKKARDARDLLVDGKDPINERDALKAAETLEEAATARKKAREALTLARAAREYHERVIEKRMTEKHAAQWISSLENHMPKALWNTPLASIEPPELFKALQAIKPHARARNLRPAANIMETIQRIRQRLEAVFEDAMFQGHCAKNPAAALRRKIRDEMPKKDVSKLAALDYREVPAFMAKLRAAPGVAARCLELALLTASRTGEVLGACWSEFDLEQGTWTIPGARMKAGEPHVVHLSERAKEIIVGQIGLDNTLLFPSLMKRSKGKPLSNMSMLMTLGRLGMRDRTTVHGLCRASFSTWAYETAAARPDVIEACLAHREADRVKAAYNRAQFNEERKALLNAWAEYLSQPRAILRAA